MEQHPIPRQITTFEFKLIGFLTIKQFIYILVFAGFGFLSYLLTPVPFLNYLAGVVVGLIGFFFAFVPINDRPMDVWVRNLIKRLTSPTQYIFKKENKPPLILVEIATKAQNDQIVYNYIDSQQKLNHYLSNNLKPNQKKQTINKILEEPENVAKTKETNLNKNPISEQRTLIFYNNSFKKQPFISGFVKNYKNLPLAGILIYIKKDEKSSPIRILKTNSKGIFLSFNQFPSGEYIFEIKDPRKIYFFDTIKLRVDQENNSPIEIRSKEMI